MDENQDRTRVLASPDGDAWLLVVADGLGGHSGAALGAQAVVNTAERLWSGGTDSSCPEELLRRLAIESHESVNTVGRETGTSPKTTVAALLIKGSKAVSVHVGDSRVMQLDGDRLVKRTLDHSIGQLGVLRGAIAEEQLATHPDQKKLFTHIGGEERPDFEINQWDISAGQRFVLCSDGFWELFPVDEIHDLYESADPIRELGMRLGEKLASLQRHDNTSAILAEVDTGARTKWSWAALGLLALIGLVAALLQELETGLRPALPETSNQSTESEKPELFNPSIRGAQNEIGTTEAEWLYLLVAQTTTQEGSLHPNSGSPSDETVEDGKGTTQGESPDGETAPSRHAIANEPIYLRPNRVIPAGKSTSDAVREELREAGRLGTNDTLDLKSKARLLGDKSIVRLEQMHKGIPVFAAELVVTLDGNRMVNIQGHTASSIEIETAPSNDYRRTIALARQSMRSRIETLDGGSLVIIQARGRFRLGWFGVVAIDGVQQSTIFDAETGEILFQEPTTIGKRLTGV